MFNCTKKTDEEPNPEPEPGNIPEVTTSPVTAITYMSATSGGEIISEGDSAVTTRGICWSTGHNPDITDDTTINLEPTVAYTCAMSDLTASTTYYVRAYAINAIGTAYGQELSFKTIALPSVPELITTEISQITQTSAVSGGWIVVQGSSQVIARGVCWNTSPLPTFENDHTLDGAGFGAFTSNVTDLTPNTTYYLRAYAKNLNGLGYGEEFSFTTKEAGSPPTVITLDVTNIGSNSATGGGDITDQGASSVTIRGVCWSTSPEPSLADNFTEDGPGSGVYSSDMDMLDPETMYYVRAYASNNSGTSYGNEVSFTTQIAGVLGEPCPYIPTVTYEGKVYNTNYIGGQCWLKENLDIGTKILGSDEMTDNGVIEKYCYEDLDENCDTYGGLYKWDELMNYTNTEGTQGICPEGWHVPTIDELNYTLGFLGSEFVAGGKMKSTGTIEGGTGLWYEPNTGATNESGFTGHPGGGKFESGWNSLGETAAFWTSSEVSDYSAWYLYLTTNYDDANLESTQKGSSYSVRCLKD